MGCVRSYLCERPEVGNKQFEIDNVLTTFAEERFFLIRGQQREVLIQIDQVKTSPSFVEVGLARDVVQLIWAFSLRHEDPRI